MHRRGREIGAILLLCASLSGCASMRRNAPSPDLRPCTDGFAYTRDGWRLGVRHYRPAHPDPGKLPVILCHGMGLNATFWTITDNHLPAQLTERGYEVYVYDIRASGENGRPGRQDRINRFLRETPFRERGESSWTVDDLVRYDMPAILDYVERETGQSRVNWVGHSLGGMMMFPFLELSTEPERIANFVGMGSTIIQAERPTRDMLAANASIRACSAWPAPGGWAGRSPSSGCREWRASTSSTTRPRTSTAGRSPASTATRSRIPVPGPSVSSPRTCGTATCSRRTARSTTRRGWARSRCRP